MPRAPGDISAGTIPNPEMQEPISRLRAFQREFERVFTALAAFLMGFGQKSDALLADIGRFASADRTKLVASAVTASRDMAVTYREQVGAFVVVSRSFIGQSEIVTQALVEITDALQVVDRMSTSLRLTGMNAVVSASRAGARARALSVLAGEFTKLAHAESVLAQQLLGISAQLRDQLGGVAEIRARLDTLSRAGVDEAAQPLADLFSALESVFGDLMGVVDRAKQIQGIVGQVMVGLQEQDILRQGLDHVLLVLGELQREHAALADGDDSSALERQVSYLCFQDTAATLAARLLGRSEGELRSLSDNTRSATGAMSDALSLLIGARQTMQATVDDKLHRPAELLDQLAANLQSQLAESKRYGAVVARVTQLADGLSAAFSSLHVVRSQLRAIRLLMSMEIARMPDLHSEASLVAEIAAGESALGVFLEKNRGVLDRLTAALSTMAHLSRSMEGDRDQLAEMNRALRERPRAILDAGTEFMARFEELLRGGEEMRREMSTMAGELERFSERLGEVAQVRSTCEGRAADARALRAQLVPDADGRDWQVRPGRLSELIDHFTVFSHKQIGAEVTDSDVADGDAGGTLTLF